MNKPHKYAEVIKAWADGAMVQWRPGANDKWRTWLNNGVTPSFVESAEWRVKPLPPKEPDYAAIAAGSYLATSSTTGISAWLMQRWEDTVNAVLRAKDEYEVALKVYNENL